MKAFLLGILVLASASLCEAQTIRIIPDSSAPTQSLSVTIVGSGTHFLPSGGVSFSMVAISLQRSGQILVLTYPINISNDSSMSASLSISGSLDTGYYDLVVQRLDSTKYNYKETNGFRILPPPPPPVKLLSVSPSSAYDSQTVKVKIMGQSTNFGSGSTPTVYFQRAGTSYFMTQPDSIANATMLFASVTVPSNAPKGAYDVIVQNGIYSDTGLNLFTVLGPAPSISVIPDSGAASTTFGVTIVGQNTNFLPQGYISGYDNIYLKQNGITYFHTTKDSVFSNILMSTVLALSDTLVPGTYDFELQGTTYQGGIVYDLHTPFLVTPHPIISVGNHNAPRADTVTITVTGTGVNFISGTQDVATVQLVKEDPETITASKVTVTSNTTLTAFFTIPSTAPPGFYDIAITEPGTNRIVTGPKAFSVEGVAPDTAYSLTIKKGSPGSVLTDTIRYSQAGTIALCTPSTYYLQHNTFIIPATLIDGSRYPDTTIISFRIPTNADTGEYDLMMPLGIECEGDTTLVPNAFTVNGAADVPGSNPFAGEISDLHVSPNPTQDNLTISFAVASHLHVRLRLFDALGRTITTLCDRNLGMGAQSFEWSAHELPAGCYFYELTTGEEMYGGRMVVRH